MYDSVYEAGSPVIGLALEAGDWQDNERSEYIFDGLGRLTQTVERMPEDNWRRRFNLDYFDPAGHVQESSEWYDGPAWPSDPSLLHWTTTWLDGLGRPTVVTKPDRSEDSYEYLGDSVTTVTRSVGDTFYGGDVHEHDYSVTRQVDALGRLRKLYEEVTSGTSLLTEYSYDEKDRLVRVALADQTRTFQYSNGGFLTASLEPERSTWYGDYDALGNVRSEKVGTPDSLATEFFYDGFGRLITKTVPDGSSSSHYYGDTFLGAGEWQPAHNKVVRSEQVNVYPNTTDTVMVTHDWEYGGPGSRVASRATSISGLGDEEDRFELGYEYDRWGNPGRVFHPWWSWTEACNPPLLQEHVFDGPWLLQSDFYLNDDAYGGVDLHYHENGRTGRVDFYLGEHSSQSDGYELESEDPNGMPRPAGYAFSWTSGSPPPSWGQGLYGYDGSGNITAIGGTPAKHYTYDGLNRLTGYYQDGVGQSYAYDDYGNLINLAGLSLLVDTDTNRLTTVGGVSVAGEWDLRGNLTKVPSSAGGRAKRLWYSAEDRLMKSKDITSEQTWRYAYDSSGERVAAWQRDSQGQLLDVTLFLRDEAGRVLSDWQLIPGVSFGPKRDYLYAGDRLALQLDWTAEGPVRRYIAVDHLNSTRAIVDDSGNVEQVDYYPFAGFLTGDPVPDTTHLFTGHERDTAELASNLDYMHARYFSPNLGRFLSVDPLRQRKPGGSQAWNGYAFALGNPLKFVDPEGKIAVLTGTEEQQKMTLAALKNILPTDLRMFVRTTTDARGQTVIDENYLRMGVSAASGNFEALSSLAASDKVFGLNASVTEVATSEGTMTLGANGDAIGVFLDEGGLSPSKAMSFVFVGADLSARDKAVTFAHEIRHAAIFALGKPFDHEMGLFEESPGVFNAFDPNGAVNRATAAAEREADANFDPFSPQD